MVEEPKSSELVGKAKGFANLKPGYKPPKKKKELTVRCQDLTDECANTLAKILKNEKERTADRIKAAEIILAYGWGKPKQQTEISGQNGGAITFGWLTDGE